MTSTKEKFRGVFLAALLVMSVFAGVPMTASAALSSANVSDGHTYTLGELKSSSVSQTITVAGAANTDVTIDVSEAQAAGFSVSTKSSSDVANTPDSDASDGELTFHIADGTSPADIKLSLSNSSNVDPDSRITYEVSTSGASESAAFKVIKPSSTTITKGQSETSVTAYSGEELTLSAAKDTTIGIYKNDGNNNWNQEDRFSTSPGDTVNYGTEDLDGKYVVTFDGAEPDSAPDSWSSSGSEIRLNVSPLNLEVEADETNVTTEENITATVSSEAFGDAYYAELYEEGADFEDDSPIKRVEGQFDGVGDAEIDLWNMTAFDDYGAGDYVIRAVHNNSNVEATSETLNVTAAGDADVSFNGSGTIYEERGDIAEFTVDLTNRDDAYVEFGGQDSNFLTNFTVEDGSDDDNSVTVYVNTNATKGATNVDQFISVSDSDSMSVANDDGGDGPDAYGEQGIYTGDPLTPVDKDGDHELSDPIADGSYNIIVAQKDDEREAKRILSLSKPSVDEVNSWVYSGSSLPDTDERADLVDNLNKAKTIAQGDTVVVEAKVSGIHGYINGSSLEKATFGYGDDDDMNSRVFMNVTEQNTGPNTQSSTYYTDTVDKTYYDADNNTVYYAFKTASDEELAAGSSYEADFKVKKANPVFTTTQNASAEFDVEEQSMEITGLNSSDVLELEAGENATVTGTTNLAPGTTVSVEVESSGKLFTNTTEVDSNGEFSATFDLSQFDAGTSMNRVYAEGADTSAEVTDVMLVENVPEDDTDDTTTTTTNGTDDTSTTTEQKDDTSTTTEPMDDGEDTSTTTSGSPNADTETTTKDNTGSIPGFGVAVSMVALVAAALLALRRSN